MTLERAIARYENWSKDDRISEEIREEHGQVAEWLKLLSNLPPEIIEDLKTNKYRKLANVFDEATKTLETLAEIKDINMTFGENSDAAQKEEQLLAQFNGQINRINDYMRDMREI